MQIVKAGQRFSFNYTTYDQNPSLYVAFSVYEIVSGVPVFQQLVVSAYQAFGSYVGAFVPNASSAYLIIGLVYTDNTYSTVDSTRSPTSDVFVEQSLNTFSGFSYAAYSQSSALHLQATIYNLSSGVPVFDSNVSMSHVINGVYFGSFTGTEGNTYQINGVVYTSGTFTTPDYSYAPSCEIFDCLLQGFNFSGVIGSANLVGQNLNAILIGDS